MTIKEAYDKIKSSDELKKKAIAAFKEGKVDEFLKENGFDITMDQIKEFASKYKEDALSKEELDLATGGGCESDSCDVTDWLYSVASLGFGCVISGVVNTVKEVDAHTYSCL